MTIDAHGMSHRAKGLPDGGQYETKTGMGGDDDLTDMQSETTPDVDDMTDEQVRDMIQSTHMPTPIDPYVDLDDVSPEYDLSADGIDCLYDPNRYGPYGADYADTMSDRDPSHDWRWHRNQWDKLVRREQQAEGGVIELMLRSPDTSDMVPDSVVEACAATDDTGLRDAALDTGRVPYNMLQTMSGSRDQIVADHAARLLDHIHDSTDGRKLEPEDTLKTAGIPDYDPDDHDPIMDAGIRGTLHRYNVPSGLLDPDDDHPDADGFNPTGITLLFRNGGVNMAGNTYVGSTAAAHHDHSHAYYRSQWNRMVRYQRDRPRGMLLDTFHDPDRWNDIPDDVVEACAGSDDRSLQEAALDSGRTPRWCLKRLTGSVDPVIARKAAMLLG